MIAATHETVEHPLEALRLKLEELAAEGVNNTDRIADAIYGMLAGGGAVFPADGCYDVRVPVMGELASRIKDAEPAEQRRLIREASYQRTPDMRMPKPQDHMRQGIKTAQGFIG